MTPIRIKSPFYDYYDAIQREGQDQELVYIRTPVELRFDDKTSKTCYPFPRYSFEYESGAITYIVGFCGKLYPILKIWDGDGGVSMCFNADQALEVFKKRENNKRYNWKWTANSLANFFSYSVDPPHRYFDEYRCPIFVAKYQYREGEVTINGNLKQVEFYRIFDPYQAFQEIAMYLGNQAQPNKPIPEIDDKTMVEIKGFDPKWSFRKPPKEKK